MCLAVRWPLSFGCCNRLLDVAGIILCTPTAHNSPCAVLYLQLPTSSSHISSPGGVLHTMSRLKLHFLVFLSLTASRLES